MKTVPFLVSNKDGDKGGGTKEELAPQATTVTRKAPTPIPIVAVGFYRDNMTRPLRHGEVAGTLDGNPLAVAILKSTEVLNFNPLSDTYTIKGILGETEYKLFAYAV
jgi:hypothetical protein